MRSSTVNAFRSLSREGIVPLSPLFLRDTPVTRAGVPSVEIPSQADIGVLADQFSEVPVPTSVSCDSSSVSQSDTSPGLVDGFATAPR